MPHSFSFIVETTECSPPENIVKHRENGYRVVEVEPSLHGSLFWEKVAEYERSYPNCHFKVMWRFDGFQRGYDYVFPPNHREQMAIYKNGLLNNELDALMVYFASDIESEISKSELFERIVTIGQSTNSADEIDKVIFLYHKKMKWRDHGDREVGRFFSLLRRGVKFAISSEHPSLIETLIYCLRGLVEKYPSFMCIANQLSKNDCSISRALNWLNKNYYDEGVPR